MVGDKECARGFAAAGAAQHAFGGPEEADDEGGVEREHEAISATDGGVPAVGERVGTEGAEDEEEYCRGLGVQSGMSREFFAEADARDAHTEADQKNGSEIPASLFEDAFPGFGIFDRLFG